METLHDPRDSAPALLSAGAVSTGPPPGGALIDALVAEAHARYADDGGGTSATPEQVDEAVQRLPRYVEEEIPDPQSEPR